jgi:nucleoside-diphosphate-sugar epimerase
MSQVVLVTGASGFVGSWCVHELLQKGYTVRGTVRDPDDVKKTKFLRALPGAAERLELVKLNLLGPISEFESAAKGCNFIMHTASPFPISAPKNADELVIPAMEGTLKMLQASKAVGIDTRVVITSSVAAVSAGHSKKDGEQYTEDDWSVENLEEIGAYQLSKTKAERAAWKFMEEEKPEFSLCTVNPCLVMGPCLNSELGTSQEILKRILNKELPACPKLSFQLVDVRDVAKCHVLAMETGAENAGRFICADKGMWMQVIHPSHYSSHYSSHSSSTLTPSPHAQPSNAHPPSGHGKSISC